jgi:hypothetical protein
MGGGGAQRPVWLVNEPKKTGAHGRARAAKTLYQSKKNVRNEMKKIRQTNFTQ